MSLLTKFAPDLDEKTIKQMIMVLNPSHVNPFINARNRAAHAVCLDQARDFISHDNAALRGWLAVISAGETSLERPLEKADEPLVRDNTYQDLARTFTQIALCARGQERQDLVSAWRALLGIDQQQGSVDDEDLNVFFEDE